LELSGPVQACNGIALLLTFTLLPLLENTEILWGFRMSRKRDDRCKRKVGIKAKVFFRDVFWVENLSRYVCVGSIVLWSILFSLPTKVLIYFFFRNDSRVY